MYKLLCVRRRMVIFCAVLLGLFYSSLAHSQGVIDCSLGGHGKNCEVQLSPGQISAVVQFRPTVTSPSGPHSFYVMGKGIGNPTVTLASDQTARINWSQPTPPSDTIIIYVQTMGVPIVQTDTIRIYPAATLTRKITLQNDLAPYVWLRNSWIPISLRIGVEGQDGVSLSQTDCEQLRFSLQAIPDGDAAPDTGRAIYEDGASPYNCFVEARWKFADVTGRQVLGVRIGEQLVRVPGVAREPPRIAAGLAFFTKHASNDTRYCDRYDQGFEDCHANRESFTDSVQKTHLTTHRKVWQPVFAVEAPFVVWRQTTGGPGLALQQHLRVVAGSSFVKPADNAFVGLTFLPLIHTEFESWPIQIQTAWRLKGGFVGG